MTSGLTAKARVRDLVDRIWTKEQVLEADELLLDEFDWTTIPKALWPKLNEREDAQRSARAAVEAFATICGAIIDHEKTFAFCDVCAGDGDLSLGLAHMIGASKYLAVDLDRTALSLLRNRAIENGQEAQILQSDVADVDASSVGDCGCIVGFKACGAVADLAINLAVEAQLPFILVPCCHWKALLPRGSGASFVGAARPDHLKYPRSAWLTSHLGKQDSVEEEYQALVAADDSPAARSMGTGPKTPLYKRAHRLLDLDRLKVTEESPTPAYTTRAFCFPGAADEAMALLAGAPATSAAAQALTALDLRRSPFPSSVFSHDNRR